MIANFYQALAMGQDYYISPSKQSHETSTIISPILQINCGKEKVTCLSSYPWQKWDSNPGSLTSEFTFLTTVLINPQ